MLNLPDVTLVTIDNVAHELAELAIEDTLKHCKPKSVVVFSDYLWFNISIKGTWVDRIIPFNDHSPSCYERCLWHEVPKHIDTSHFLVIQFDSWVINPNAWTDDFLSYDYIGAVWPWHREYRVGNGGFSLRSTKLAKWLSENFQPPIHHEDDSLCRNILPSYPQWRIAGDHVADRFSREHTFPAPLSYPHLSFGFHDCRNWIRVLDKDQLQRRIELGKQNPYVNSKPEFQQLVEYTNL